jgi:tRNA-specific 2-thiouridylase
MSKKIAVLVSGGVDSSVSLALLKEQGFDITAFYLKIWLEDELSYLGDCPWEEDVEYAQKVCEQLGVPLNILPLQKEYFAEVVSYTINEVKNGRTPNPDVMCNNRIKFGMFLSKIDDSFEKVATGHYAKVTEIGQKSVLMKSKDSFKDQTYFLSNLSQEQLSRAMFPIGRYTKQEVRELAEKFDLANKNRKDSQGICFLGKLKFRDFLKHYLGEKEGELIEFETQKVVGTHQGFWYYTIGQRQNIRLSGGPWYVVDKNPAENKIYVSKNYQELSKSRDEFEITNLNLINPELLNEPELEVKLRHGEKLYKCQVEQIESGRYRVKLDDQDQGIAAGQFAVFYLNELCIGCGVIA